MQLSDDGDQDDAKILQTHPGKTDRSQRLLAGILAGITREFRDMLVQIEIARASHAFLRSRSYTTQKTKDAAIARMEAAKRWQVFGGIPSIMLAADEQQGDATAHLVFEAFLQQGPARALFDNWPTFAVFKLGLPGSFDPTSSFPKKRSRDYVRPHLGPKRDNPFIARQPRTASRDYWMKTVKDHWSTQVQAFGASQFDAMFPHLFPRVLKENKDRAYVAPADLMYATGLLNVPRYRALSSKSEDSRHVRANNGKSIYVCFANSAMQLLLAFPSSSRTRNLLGGPGQFGDRFVDDSRMRSGKCSVADILPEWTSVQTENERAGSLVLNRDPIVLAAVQTLHAMRTGRMREANYAMWRLMDYVEGLHYPTPPLFSPGQNDEVGSQQDAATFLNAMIERLNTRFPLQLGHCGFSSLDVWAIGKHGIPALADKFVILIVSYSERNKDGDVSDFVDAMKPDQDKKQSRPPDIDYRDDDSKAIIFRGKSAFKAFAAHKQRHARNNFVIDADMGADVASELKAMVTTLAATHRAIFVRPVDEKDSDAPAAKLFADMGAIVRSTDRFPKNGTMRSIADAMGKVQKSRSHSPQQSFASESKLLQEIQESIYVDEDGQVKTDSNLNSGNVSLNQCLPVLDAESTRSLLQTAYTNALFDETRISVSPRHDMPSLSDKFGLFVIYEGGASLSPTQKQDLDRFIEWTCDKKKNAWDIKFHMEQSSFFVLDDSEHDDTVRNYHMDISNAQDAEHALKIARALHASHYTVLLRPASYNLSEGPDFVTLVGRHGISLQTTALPSGAIVERIASQDYGAGGGGGGGAGSSSSAGRKWSLASAYCAATLWHEHVSERRTKEYLNNLVVPKIVFRRDFGDDLTNLKRLDNVKRDDTTLVQLLRPVVTIFDSRTCACCGGSFSCIRVQTTSSLYDSGLEKEPRQNETVFVHLTNTHAAPALMKVIPHDATFKKQLFPGDIGILDRREKAKAPYYKLSGIIYHKGETRDSGHFTALVRNPAIRRDWRYIDDVDVHLLTDDDANEMIRSNQYSSSAVILMFSVADKHA